MQAKTQGKTTKSKSRIRHVQQHDHENHGYQNHRIEHHVILGDMLLMMLLDLAIEFLLLLMLVPRICDDHAHGSVNGRFVFPIGC